MLMKHSLLESLVLNIIKRREEKEVDRKIVL